MTRLNHAIDAGGTVRLLVIQLARLGDSLQTLMALRAAKQLYPQLSVSLIVRERFSAAARSAPWLDEVFTLPTDRLVGPVVRGEASEAQAIPEVAKWLTPLVRAPWDIVANWTFSDSSSFLAALLPARFRLGYSRRSDLSHMASDGWSQYMQAVVQGGVDQNIHLTDILTTQLLTALQLKVGDPIGTANMASAARDFFSISPAEHELAASLLPTTRKWVAFQLGAGNPRKTWSPDRWARLARLILDSEPDLGIAVLGGAEDKGRADAFRNELSPRASEASRLVNLVGATPFGLWASVIGRADWLFGADTAAIHLASILGTRVANLSIGPVRWCETGPYGNHHLVVSARSPCLACGTAGTTQETHSCESDVTPEAVHLAWSFLSMDAAAHRQISFESHAAALDRQASLGSISAYRSRIRPIADGGGIAYEPLLPRSASLQEWTSSVIGHMARSWYCGWTPAVGADLPRHRIDPALVRALRRVNEAMDVLIRVLSEARETARKLSSRGGSLKSASVMDAKDRTELQALASKLSELEKLVERLGATEPSLKAFSNLIKVMMHNLKGTAIGELGAESATAYSQLIDGATTMKQWVEFTLRLAKPVGVRPAPIVQIGASDSRVESDVNP